MDFDTVEDDGGDDDKASSSGPKKKDVLSFRELGRPLDADGLVAEFSLMLSFFPKGLDAEDFRRVGVGSGSHLVKLTTPRTELGQSVLRFSRAASNERPAFIPSINAPDIPVAKIVYRPLEIIGREAKTVVDHLREPDDMSAIVLDAFCQVFGLECLEALRASVAGEGEKIERLPETGEFPIIFLPRPGGGDIQATPVSPAEAFMGFKNMASAWFQKQEKDGPPVPRGRWSKQSISAKPQNISGAIGGPRQRFLAEMPSVMRGYEAAILRYALGGNFPAWREDDVESAVLHYAGWLEREYTNSAIRAETDRCADRLIAEALSFIEEVRKDARDLLEREGKTEKALPRAPRPSALILRRKWKKDDRDKAMKALTSPHFHDRERIAIENLER